MSDNRIAETDDALVQRAKGGDEVAFGMLFDRHRDLVFRFVLQMIRNRDEAEDLVQEAFVRAYQNLGNYRDQAKFTTWLLRIATNLCTDRVRMSQRRHNLEQREATEGLLWMTEDNNEDPNANLEDGRKMAVIRQAIESLPEHHRNVIVMRDIEEMEYVDIAAVLGCTVGGVKLRVLRARRALRDRVLPMWEEQSC
jgi:RNA polymerase sigma-70 factor (ECF subfamily)